jgi:hypothetical protein
MPDDARQTETRFLEETWFLRPSATPYRMISGRNSFLSSGNCGPVLNEKTS